MSDWPCVITAPEHPHRGCRGHVVVSDQDSVTVHTMFGKRTVRVELDDCKHGTDACFVQEGKGALREDRRAR